MSKERELLAHALDRLKHINFEDDHLTNDLIQTIQKYLAQPEQEQEQEPVAWMSINNNGGISIDSYYANHRDYIPLYTAPPKREPFVPEERQRLSKAYSTRAEQVAFEEGIIFAEISYGIGGGE